MTHKTENTRETERRVLVVDDDPRICRLLEYNLGKWGYIVESVGNALAMRDALGRHPYDVVLLDVRLPDGNGVDLLPMVMDAFPETKIIIMSAHGHIEMAMDAVRLGAFDFLAKPLDLDRCRVSVRNAFHLANREREYAFLSEVISGRDRFGSIIGATPSMQAVYEIVSNVAASDCSVLVTGETGTGKELVAQELHLLSARRQREMITINCAAIPSELIESEIFGHVKGSFTGATLDKCGAAERANHSTLFLDEISELNIQLQAKLLRFLQDKLVTKVGGMKSQLVDTRIIAATNIEPEDAVSRGKLRRDLLYRINVIHIHIPPLRERRADIPLLAEAFLTQAATNNGKLFKSIESKALRILMEADWPGNVRQLKNVITETVLLNRGECVTAEMLPASIRTGSEKEIRYQPVPSQTPGHSRVRPLWETEKTVMQQALFASHGNVAQASEMLEISRTTLYRRIKQYDLGYACKTTDGVKSQGGNGQGL